MGKTLREYLWISGTSLTVALLLMSKWFFFPDCAPFDLVDDANHTFLNLAISRDAMAHLQLPLFNFYNNFGTPLTGDAITYPFALHALTYWVLPNDLAMGVNRILALSMTLFLLTVFYRRYLSLSTSLLCACLSLMTPGLLWHITHHHYQFTLFWFLVTVLLYRRGAGIFPLFLSLTCFQLSVSINLFLLSLPFLFGFALLEKDERSSGLLALAVAFFASVLMLVPEYRSFLQAVAGSGRKAQNYQAGVQYDEASFLNGLFFQQASGIGHFGLAFYIPLPILLGMSVLLFRLKSFRLEVNQRRMVVWLGMLPVAIALAFIADREVWWAIPLLRSTDITRILWFASIFINLGFGLLVSRWTESPPSREIALVWLTALGVIVSYGWSQNVIGAGPGAQVGLSATFMAPVIALLGARGRLRRGPGVLLALAAFTFLVDSTADITSITDYSSCSANRPFFSDPRFRQFNPIEFMKLVRPERRLACATRSELGNDLKPGLNHIFGSGGRSVLLNATFADELQRRKLVKVDQSPLAYHFVPPWNVEDLRELGIGYVVQTTPTWLGDNPPWLPIASGAGLTEGRQSQGTLYLFEDPHPTGVVYLKTPTETLTSHHLEIGGNYVRVDLKEFSRPGILTLTFLSAGDWTAYLDGARVTPRTNSYGFVQLPVSGRESSFELRYEEDYLAQQLLSMALAIVVLLAFSRPRLTFG